jgi:hypothetical protein
LNDSAQPVQHARPDRGSNRAETQVTLGRMLEFFIPLGISASLVTISHVIINSTLARAEHQELVIASYAIAMSLLTITERPAVLLRQACSALVRDKTSFKAMAAVANYIFLSILLLGLLISYTRLGHWIFLYIFGVDPAMLSSIIQVYRVLMFVSIFSGIRCLYQGVIIINLHTKWLTLGMLIRLFCMYMLSLYFIQTDRVTSGQVGAVIFLTGMMIEATVSFLEGRHLVRRLPDKLPDHPVENKKHVFGFYRPMLYSSFIAVVIGPAINAMLGKTANIELAIASFAIASSITQLVSSFFSYVHQMVLNFYKIDPAAVNRFVRCVAFVPALLLGVIGYTPLGPWFMEHVMGANERLMQASLDALRVFMLMALVFPWLDFANGMIMMRGQTKAMVWSQGANMVLTVTLLTILVAVAPGWNGMIGALAQSAGLAAELGVVFYVLRKTRPAVTGSVRV